MLETESISVFGIPGQGALCVYVTFCSTAPYSACEERCWSCTSALLLESLLLGPTQVAIQFHGSGTAGSSLVCQVPVSYTMRLESCSRVVASMPIQQRAVHIVVASSSGIRAQGSSDLIRGGCGLHPCPVATSHAPHIPMRLQDFVCCLLRLPMTGAALWTYFVEIVLSCCVPGYLAFLGFGLEL